MIHPLIFLGVSLIGTGLVWIGYTMIRLVGRVRVDGDVIGYSEVSNSGLTDSMYVMKVQYTGLDGKKALHTTRPRTSIFWREVGAKISVYLSRKQNTQPIIAEFTGLWLMSLTLLCVGVLCIALSQASN